MDVTNITSSTSNTIVNPSFQAPQNDLLEQYNQQSDQCDLVVICLDKKNLRCHSSILYSERSVVRIYLSGCTLDHMKLVTDYLYYGRISIPTQIQAIRVLLGQFSHLRPKSSICKTLKSCIIEKGPQTAKISAERRQSAKKHCQSRSVTSSIRTERAASGAKSPCSNVDYDHIHPIAESITTPPFANPALPMSPAVEDAVTPDDRDIEMSEPAVACSIRANQPEQVSARASTSETYPESSEASQTLQVVSKSPETLVSPVVGRQTDPEGSHAATATDSTSIAIETSPSVATDDHPAPSALSSLAITCASTSPSPKSHAASESQLPKPVSVAVTSCTTSLGTCTITRVTEYVTKDKPTGGDVKSPSEDNSLSVQQNRDVKSHEKQNNPLEDAVDESVNSAPRANTSEDDSSKASSIVTDETAALTAAPVHQENPFQNSVSRDVSTERTVFKCLDCGKIFSLSIKLNKHKQRNCRSNPTSKGIGDDKEKGQSAAVSVRASVESNTHQIVGKSSSESPEVAPAPVRGKAVSKDGAVVRHEAEGPKDAAEPKDKVAPKDSTTSKDTPVPNDAAKAKEKIVQKDSPVPKDAAKPKDAARARDKVLPKDSAVSKDTPVPQDAAKPKDKVLTKDPAMSKDTTVPKDAAKAKDKVAPKDSAVSKDAAKARHAAKPKDKVLPKDSAISEDKVVSKNLVISKDKAVPKDSAVLKDRAVPKDAALSKDTDSRNEIISGPKKHVHLAIPVASPQPISVVHRPDHRTQNAPVLTSNRKESQTVLPPKSPVTEPAAAPTKTLTNFGAPDRTVTLINPQKSVPDARHKKSSSSANRSPSSSKEAHHRSSSQRDLVHKDPKNTGRPQSHHSSQPSNTSNRLEPTASREPNHEPLHKSSFPADKDYRRPEMNIETSHQERRRTTLINPLPDKSSQVKRRASASLERSGANPRKSGRYDDDRPLTLEDKRRASKEKQDNALRIAFSANAHHPRSSS